MLLPGAKIGAYEIVASLGSGGMGEVYRALDSRLGREVALKILPEAFAGDSDRLLRFEREARTLAALNHPRIAQIYGFEQTPPADGRPTLSVLVMELVEGEDLAARLARGPIPLDEALPIARQIAEGVAAAHAVGIVHRDLKPANVKVRRDGSVKVLDFGLAKTGPDAAASSPGAASPVSSPTITSPAAITAQGMILGTAAYMSPEQARGRFVDHRADVWAFGCVLYEMLTGERLFAGQAVTETLAEVLRKEIDFSRLPSSTPEPIRRLLRRCLERDPERRLRAIADAELELDDAATAPAGVAVDPGVASRTPRWTLAVGALIAGLAIGAGLAWFARAPASPSSSVPSARMFTMTGAGFNFAGLAAISRDGRWLAYAPDAEGPPFRLYLRSLGSFETRQIATSADTGLNPFFSPDGQWLAFFSNGQLHKVPLAGGDPQFVADTAGPEFRQGAWATDGTIVFSAGIEGSQSGLWKLVPGASEPSALTKAPEGESHLAPEILADGRTVLFTRRTAEAVSIASVPIASGPVQVVLNAARSPRFAASGHLFFQRAGTDDLMTVRFDPRTLEVSGEPSRLTAVALVYDVSAYAVADDGTLLYSAPGETAENVRYSIVAVDREGNERPLLDEPGGYAQPRVSPDGKSILYRLVGQPACDMWTLDLARGARTRVTLDGDNHDPLWHPNARDIAWSSQLPSGFEIRTGPVDRSRPVRTLIKGSETLAPASWAPDGRVLAYVESAPDGGGGRPAASRWDIRLLDVESGTSRPFAETRFTEKHPAFSPDGRWIAWVSNETGRDEVYIQRLAGSEGRLQVSTGGGEYPVWSADGKELFYAEASRLMGVTLQLGATPQAGRPRSIIEGSYAWERFGNYDVLPNGREFVFIKRSGLLGATAILRVVLDWPALARSPR